MSVLAVLTGLSAGFALGFAAAASGSAWLVRGVDVIEPIGTLFVNAIRATVVPLVVSKLIVAMASAEASSLRRLGGRSLLICLALLAFGALFGGLAGAPLLGLVAVDARAIAVPASTPLAPAAPSLEDWIGRLVPVNAIQAAAEGAMLPLILFSLAFGLALTRVAAARRSAVVGLFEGVSDAMLVLVRWVLRAAPAGVFALAVPLGSRLGLQLVGALVAYLLAVAVACSAFALLVLYPLAVVVGRRPLGAFARAIWPAQAIAFSSRSSLASLPVMIESGRTGLALSEGVVSFFLPLAAALLRVGSGLAMVIATAFAARLYGVSLDLTDMASVVATAALSTLGSPGVPSGGILQIVPVLMAGGVPVDAVGVLLAADTLPDMVRTTTNITANMAVATMLEPEAAG